LDQCPHQLYHHHNFVLCIPVAESSKIERDFHERSD
jgi:hypothetical protein